MGRVQGLRQRHPFPDLEAEVAAASFRPLTGERDEARITAFKHLLDTIDILKTVVPEACYADVHAIVLGWLPWFIAFHGTRQQRPGYSSVTWISTATSTLTISA